MANRPVTILVKKKQTTGGSVPGSALMGEPFVNLYDGVLKFSATTGGSFEPSSQTNVFEVGSLLYNQKITNRLNINNNFIISGDTGKISTYQGVSGAGLAGTFLSGTSTGYVVANISDIATTTDSYTTGATWVPNILTLKLNQGRPNVTVTIDTFNNLTVTGSSTLNTVYATTVSGGTLYSGNTNLYSIFSQLGSSVQTIGQGTNITTGGTVTNPIISTTPSLTVNAITSSGSSNFNGGLYASTLSGGTIYSANTDLYNIFVNKVNAGSNVSVGGTAISPTVNVVASPSFNNVNYSGTSIGGNSIATNVSATTFYSASTNLQNVIESMITGVTTGITSTIQNGLNTYTGGTSFFPTINISAATLNNLSVSAGTTLNTLSANTISGGTIYSANTDIYNIFVNKVNAGSNVSIGGTAISPTVNVVASPSFNNINFSGTSTGGNLYAVNLSGGSIFSGSTNLQSTFDLINAQVATKANLSGATFTGAISATAITDTALTSGWAVYAGSGGLLKTNSGFTYDDAAKRLYAENIQIGTPSLSGVVDIWGDVVVHGQSISAFTSQLYVEDNNVILNYNPTANTTSTSIGAGWTIQDGSGVAGTDVYFNIAGTATTVDNRSFTTNLADIRIRETGTFSNPNGVRLLAETDILDGGTF